MKYQTTNLQPIKRYPTYQFHADTAQKKLPVSQVFCICVLETLRWLRSRLQKFDSLPADICTPKPENYADFSTEQLHSFSFSMASTWTCFTWKTVDCGRSICLNRMPVPTSAHPENVPQSTAESLRRTSLF